jgi:hypothetical protein
MVASTVEVPLGLKITEYVVIHEFGKSKGQ